MKKRPHKKPKILFVALANSSHTHAWINLLRGQEDLDVCLFGIDYSLEPGSFTFPTYSLSKSWPRLSAGKFIYFNNKRLLLKGASKVLKGNISWLEDAWLVKFINQWKPDIIHTLGLDPAAFAIQRVYSRCKLKNKCTWVVTARGGPELALNRLFPGKADKIKAVLEQCDIFIADNVQNYDYAVESGLRSSKVSELGVIPGTGGVDIEELSRAAGPFPSERERIIVWPKAYECPASKALPVFEALKMCWDKIRPCKIHMTAITQEEIFMWYHTLPADLKKSCQTHERIPRESLLELMGRSRVLLIPSLTDGIPNTLYEGMALNAFPIVSPIETLENFVESEKNVLFARNLYPQEIADSLTRAMSDDSLVDNAARNNIALVDKIANRRANKKKVEKFYRNLLD